MVAEENERKQIEKYKLEQNELFTKFNQIYENNIGKKVRIKIYFDKLNNLYIINSKA